MGLIAPAFLAGLLALAVPALLHLADRTERAGRRFPSLMFVRRVPLRTRRRRSLRDRALLALRCLALALLALAFARPFVAGEQTTALSSPEDLVLLLDRSYSMGVGERWERLSARAGEALDALPSGARVAVVLFDTRAETVQPLAADLRAARGALRQAAPGVRGTDFATAVARAGELLAESGAPVRRVLLVSDLQRVGLVEAAPLRLPEGVVLEVSDAGGDAVANATLEPLAVRRSDAAERLAVTVTTRGGGAAGDLRLELSVDGVVTETRPLDLAGGGPVRLELPLPAPSREPVRLAVRVLGDRFGVDDEQRLVLPPSRPLRVLLVAADEAASEAGVFVERALGVAEAPAVALRRVSAAALGEVTLESFEVIVLDDPAPLADGLWSRLRARVEQGAGLLVVAGERLSDGPADDGWLPAWPGAVRDLGADAARLAWSGGLRHPWAAPDGADGRAPAVVDAGVRRHRVLDPRADDEVLVRLDNGAPLLLHRRTGAGAVALLASSLDGRWSDLPRSPQFAPWLVATVRGLAARGPARSAFRLGDVVDVAEHAGAVGLSALAAHLRAGGGAIVESPDGSSTPLPPGRPLLLETPGFLEIHATGGAAGSLPVAVNVDTRESDAGVLTADEIVARVQREPVAPGAAEQAARRRLAEAGSDGAWWWLLALAGAVFVAEAMLAARMRRRAQVSGGAT